MGLAEKELKSSFTDWRFLGTIFFSFLATLFITGVLLDTVGSFSKGNLFSSLPISNKLVKIAVVEGGYHPSVAELEKITSASVIKTDLRTAQNMLSEGQVHAIYIVNETSGTFIGSNRPISVLAELAVKEAVDKVVRPDGGSKYNFNEDTGLQDLVRGLLTPILLFSPVFLWGLPIIQSIAYDRENRVLEVLFSTPIDRRRILLSKVLANMLFVGVVGAIWIAIVYFAGFHFIDPFGVFIVLLAVSFLMVAMNALVSSISRNVQEATLASSISSTVIFTALFLITMLTIIPQTQFLADISPATYVARQVTEAAAFPVYPVAVLLIIAISALVLALSAFSTEAFAFSIKPGIKQLYEGMIDILGGGYRAAIGMGFVAFSLTTPIQFIASALLIFTYGFHSLLPFLLVVLLALVEEFLKGIGVYVLRPSGLRNGILLGIVVGFSYGFGESLLFVPTAWVSHSARLILVARIMAIIAHVVSSGAGAVIFAYGISRADSSVKGRLGPIKLSMGGLWWLCGIAVATAIHSAYNYMLPWITQIVQLWLRQGII